MKNLISSSLEQIKVKIRKSDSLNGKKGAFILSLTKANVILSFISSPFYSAYITPQMVLFEFTV